jgi:hypothetical protein
MFLLRNLVLFVPLLLAFDTSSTASSGTPAQINMYSGTLLVLSCLSRSFVYYIDSKTTQPTLDIYCPPPDEIFHNGFE